MKTTKRLRILGGLLAVAVIGGFVWNATRFREPEYEGKPLSRWLESHLASSSANPPYNSPGWKKADEVLRRSGTNAIPTLLRMIRANDSSFKLKLVRLGQKQNLVRIRHRYARSLNDEAEYAFRVLGTNAASAVPALLEIYEDAVSPYSQACAAMALGHIGRPAKAALPTLLKNFTHTNAYVRFQTVSAVLNIGDEPDVVVPVLRGVLKDSYKGSRWNAVAALRNLGRRAGAAVPDLLEALNNDTAIREPVEEALWSIAPEEIPQAVVVEESTPMVANGRTTEAFDFSFKGERRTVIRPGTPVPCSVQFWSSEPRGPLSLYRATGGATAKDHFLGQFEVLGMEPPPTNANVGVLFVITEQRIYLCARDYHRDKFLEIRRVDQAGGGAK